MDAGGPATTVAHGGAGRDDGRQCPPPPPLPPLRFADPEAEAAFLRAFVEDHVRSDARSLSWGILANFLFAARLWITQPLDQCRLQLLCFAVHCALAAHCLLLMLRRPQRYVERRSWLVACLILWLPMLGVPFQLTSLSAHCYGPLPFWLRELALMYVPFGTLAPLMMPLPLQQQAWVQGGLLAAMLATAGVRRRNSFALCALSPQRYQGAAELLRAAASVTALGSPLLLVELRLPASTAYHLVDTYVQAALTFCAPLLMAWRMERHYRAKYARQQGLTADAAALEAAGEGVDWRVLALVFGAGLPALASCAVSLGGLLPSQSIPD